MWDDISVKGELKEEVTVEEHRVCVERWEYCFIVFCIFGI